jgi:hypothetical protein
MENIVAIFSWVKDHMADITQVIAYVVAVASVIVKLTPTVKDNEVLEKIIKFIGKYIALNRTVDDDAIRAEK